MYRLPITEQRLVMDQRLAENRERRFLENSPVFGLTRIFDDSDGIFERLEKAREDTFVKKNTICQHEPYQK